jgi:hypothetical protein
VPPQFDFAPMTFHVDKDAVVALTLMHSAAVGAVPVDPLKVENWKEPV